MELHYIAIASSETLYSCKKKVCIETFSSKNGGLKIVLTILNNLNLTF